jgi:hypothetical protein
MIAAPDEALKIGTRQMTALIKRYENALATRGKLRWMASLGFG